MTEIISARFKSGGKAYYFDPGDLTVEPGEGVIVETSKGQEYGECVQGNTMVEDDQVVQPLRPVVRIATEKDLTTLAQNKEKEKRAFALCEEKILAHGLDMKLVDVEYSFDGTKILFFFTSENRVDFRNLVKDLAGIFRARIELRQIGVRDEAKMLGGLGICGRPFCCSQFLDEFQPVSIKMAKTQNLSLNPTKISGTCGRLMCCLKYEQDAYEDAVKRCPKNESFVETPDGVGDITSVNLLRETVKVRLDDEPDASKSYHTTEINVVRNGKGKRPDNYIAPSKEQLEKLRKVTPKDDFDSLASRLDAMLAAHTAPSPLSEPHPVTQRRAGRPAPKKEEVKKEEPAAAAEPEKKEAKKPSKNHANRNRQNKKKQNAPKVQQPAKPEPPKGETAPAEKKKSGNNHHRRRFFHNKKKPGGGAAPKGE